MIIISINNILQLNKKGRNNNSCLQYINNLIKRCLLPCGLCKCGKIYFQDLYQPILYQK